MVAVLGRRNKTIFRPPELVVGKDSDPQVCELQALVHQFETQPCRRFETIPGAQTTKTPGGLLPSVGIIHEGKQWRASASVMPTTHLIVAGVKVPENTQALPQVLVKASFNVDPTQATTMNS